MDVSEERCVITRELIDFSRVGAVFLYDVLQSLSSRVLDLV